MKMNNQIKEQLKQAKIEEQQRKMLQKAGAVNPKWRQTFLMLWAEKLKTDLQIQTATAQIRDLSEQVKTEKNGLKRIGLKDQIETLTISREMDVVHLMVAREHLLELMGAEWTVKSVWAVINELEKVKEEAFRKSIEG